MKRLICVITSSRADFGLLKLLLQEISQDESCELKLIATGRHLSPEHGYTMAEIVDEGFEISEIFKIVDFDDSKESIARQISAIIEASLKYFVQSKPDLIVVLGDRFEIFATVASAHIAGIPVAHIHGGEITQESMDDAYRHSITKMSRLHFVSNEDHKRRVIQLGEDPKFVYNVGALGLENVLKVPQATKSQIEERLGISLSKKNLLITMHPNSMAPEKTEGEICSVLKVLEKITGATLIFTGPNGDESGSIISIKIKEFCENNKNSYYFESLGTTNYLQLARHMDAVVGNSSSGIIEIPSLGVPTINIGSRQLGRQQALSIINCRAETTEIEAALNSVFAKKTTINPKKISNPYGSGDTSREIFKVLKSIELAGLSSKKFYDITQRNNA
jgi:UDP-hydrolysing UDP-N-acetyl-D-glucosamine 2-epimerase